MIRQLAVALAAVAVAACTSVGRLDQVAAVAPTAKDSVFVLGIAPDNFRVAVFGGGVKNGIFSQNPWLSATFLGTADKGYIVSKSGQDRPLAITHVRVVEGPNGFWGAAFVPCGDAKTVVFSLPKGRVVYLGDFRYDFSGNGLRITESRDLEAARNYLRTSYPQLADSLEQGRYEVLPTSTSCTQTIMIPIYVPSR